MVLRDFPGKSRTVRTVLYGDQRFSSWEMEILHTPIVQRLYDLKQLGLSDRVFPDAVHSRFNHILGVAEVARQMVERLIEWLGKNGDEQFSYFENDELKSISGSDLVERVKEREGAVRMIALLHDLTHAAFGHTLEDEVRVFEQKHDDPRRQAIFLNALVAQLMAAWFGQITQEARCDISDLLAYSRLDSGVKNAKHFARKIRDCDPECKAELAAFLRELEFASRALLHLEWAHGSADLKATNLPKLPELPKLLVGEIRQILDCKSTGLEFVPHLDLFLLDTIGNTICADLLDYAKRDATNAGLELGFDTRLIKYVCAVSVANDLSPDKMPSIRLATQFFTDKMRYDVLSEMSAILKARYLINERILFHPAKCAVGAVLGSAIQFLGLTKPPVWVQALGDQAFLSLLDRMAHYLTEAAKRISEKDTTAYAQVATELLPVELHPRELLTVLLKVHHARWRKSGESRKEFVTNLRTNVEAAQRLLWRLRARRSPQLVYRLRLGAKNEEGDTTKEIAREFSDSHKRFMAERKVEEICRLPKGSVVIHCPTENPGVKIAQALVVGSELSHARQLRDVAQGTTSRFHNELKPYQNEIVAIESMYTSIWQLHAFLDPDFSCKASVVKLALSTVLRASNDQLMQDEPSDDTKNRYDFVAYDYAGMYGKALLTNVIQELDTLPNRHRTKRSEEEIAVDAIDKVNKGVQLDLLDND